MDCNEISCLTLKTKEIALDIDGANLWVDFAKILKCRDDVYINATPIVQKFKGREARLIEYFRLDPTKRYIEALEKKFLTDSERAFLEAKKNEIKGDVSSPFILKNQPKTILAKHGFFYKKTGRYGGTWLHKKLFLNFARWLSPKFEIACDQILEQVIMQADELKEGRDVLRKLQRPLNDVIKSYLVDTGIKTDKAYMQFAVMVKRLIGCTDERDAYTKTQLDTARSIIEEYRAMIVHGGRVSLKEMNNYLKDSPLNLAWKKNNV